MFVLSGVIMELRKLETKRGFLVTGAIGDPEAFQRYKFMANEFPQGLKSGDRVDAVVSEITADRYGIQLRCKLGPFSASKVS